MDSFVAVVAVAAWLLVMVPAAFVLFLGGADSDERPTSVPLALVPPAASEERDERVAA